MGNSLLLPCTKSASPNREDSFLPRPAGVSFLKTWFWGFASSSYDLEVACSRGTNIPSRAYQYRWDAVVRHGNLPSLVYACLSGFCDTSKTRSRVLVLKNSRLHLAFMIASTVPPTACMAARSTNCFTRSVWGRPVPRKSGCPIHNLKLAGTPSRFLHAEAWCSQACVALASCQGSKAWQIWNLDQGGRKAPNQYSWIRRFHRYRQPNPFGNYFIWHDSGFDKWGTYWPM